MTPLFILGQLWGLCAMALIVISFQCKKPARLCVVQVCACLFFILHYLFLGLNGDAAAYAGMTQNAVSVSLSRTRDKLKVYLTEEGFL